MVLRKALAAFINSSEALALRDISIQPEEDYERWPTSYVINDGERKLIKI